MKKITFLLLAMFTFSLGFSQADCGTALALTPGTPQAGATTTGVGSFSDSDTPPNVNPCSTSYNDLEYWFQYTAATNGETLSINVTGITNTYYGVFVIDNCPGSAPTCIAQDTNGSSSADLSVTTPGLTAGTVYYIVMTDWIQGPASFTMNSTVNAAPTCFQPTNLNATALAGETTAALSWNAEAGATAGYNWAVMTVGQNPAVDTAISMGTTAAGVTTDTATGLTAGTRYDFYVQSNCDTDGLSTWAGPFNFASVLPPANDECSGAIGLTVNADFACGTVTAGTTVGATASPQADDVTGTPNTDVWYSFTATSTAHRISLLNLLTQPGGTSTSTDMGIGVYDGTGGCAGLVYFGSSDPETFNLTGLSIGVEYYVRVYGWSTTIQFVNFDICVGTPPPPPANDECSGALPIFASTNNTCDNAVSGTTASANPSTTGCTGGKDVWYSFVAPVTGNYIITVTETFDSGFSSTYVSAYSGACGALTQIGSSTSCSNTSPLTIPTVSGTTYYFNVRSSSTTTYVEFDLCVYLAPPPPVNDDCAGAISLAVGSDLSCPSPVSGTTVSATQSLPGCVGTANDDVWYSFVAIGTSHTIMITNTGGASDIVTQVFDSCGGASLVCQDTPNSPIVLTGLTPANTYYFRIYTYSSTASITTNFDVCVGTPPAPPANQTCATATPIACGASISGTSVSSTGTQEGSGCTMGNNGVWYTFTGYGGDMTVTVDASFDHELAITSGTCGALVNVGCRDSSTSQETYTIANSTNGETYYVYIAHFSGSSTVTGTHTISLTCPTISVGEFAESDMFTYYPNPVNSTLSLKGAKIIQDVAIYNMLGQEVLRTAPNTINSDVDMSNLQPGTYFVQVMVDNATKTIKVIKK